MTDRFLIRYDGRGISPGAHPARAPHRQRARRPRRSTRATHAPFTHASARTDADADAHRATDADDAHGLSSAISHRPYIARPNRIQPPRARRPRERRTTPRIDRIKNPSIARAPRALPHPRARDANPRRSRHHRSRTITPRDAHRRIAKKNVPPTSRAARRRTRAYSSHASRSRREGTTSGTR